MVKKKKVLIKGGSYMSVHVLLNFFKRDVKKR